MDSPSAVKALGALAHETRLEIYRILVRAGSGGRPAGELATELGVPATTMSFHLSQLANAGLVSARRAGRSILYVVLYDRMFELLGYLTENCCSTDPDCCAKPVPLTKGRGRKDGGRS